MPGRSSTYSKLKFDKLLAYAARTADANGTAIDVRESNDVTFVFDVGAAADTLSGSVYIELELEESDDNATFTDVANSDVTNFVAGTNAGTTAKIIANADAGKYYRVGYIGMKRYVRPVVNVTGTHTNGTPVGAFVVRGRNRYSPA